MANIKKQEREKLAGWTKKHYVFLCRDLYFKVPIHFFYQEQERCDVVTSLTSIKNSTNPYMMQNVLISIFQADPLVC